jgi:hypothetical protein
MIEAFTIDRTVRPLEMYVSLEIPQPLPPQEDIPPTVEWDFIVALSIVIFP